ncbi:MAG: phosphate ABC transporter permease [Hydrogenophilales bacterium 12-61-10]|nr:MAG: phosphate ABC transporter permease [Hydrogenophilales bacterium 12-61-10]
MTQTVIVLEPGKIDKHYWKDVFQYRDLFWVLARRDVSVRYKQTVIGILWAVLRPLLTMLVFTLIFGKIAKLPSEGVPYSLLVFTGMIPWFFFASSVTESSNSLVTNANLLSKVYFPRILVPLSSVLVAAMDFAIGMVLLAMMLLYFGFMPSWRLLTIPFFLAVAFSAASGIGLLFSALNVKYRDFQFIVPFVVQFGLYLSPVGFSSSVVPEKWQLVYALNPMVGVIDGFRWAMLGDAFLIRWDIQLISVSIAVILLGSGTWFFRRFERGIADVI